MSQQSITVTIKLFAAFQEAYNVPELIWQVPADTSVYQILERCLHEHPELEPWRNVTQFGVNLQFVTAETHLKDGDEVVLIPPVSGG
ncbi:MAG: MoaD/ThiS family protein [Microcoleaceae cyanobacterium]